MSSEYRDRPATGPADRRRYFVLKGCVAPGNRLATLSSGMNYAKATRRRLLIRWSDDLCALKGESPFGDHFPVVDVGHIQSIRWIPSFQEIKEVALNLRRTSERGC